MERLEASPRLLATLGALVALFAGPVSAQAILEPNSLEVTGLDGEKLEGLRTAENELAQLREAGAPELLRGNLEIKVVGASSSQTKGSETDNAPAGTSDESRPSNAVRVLAEAGVGVASGLVGGLTGSGVGLVVGLLGATSSSSSGSPGTGLAWIIISTYIGTGVGMLAAMPIGVWAGGEIAKGEGNFLWTLLGTAGGLAASFGLVAATNQLRNSDATGTINLIGIAALPLTGGILGYELSHASNRRRQADHHRGPRFRPTVSLNASSPSAHEIDGATAGVEFRF